MLSHKNTDTAINYRTLKEENQGFSRFRSFIMFIANLYNSDKKTILQQGLWEN